MHNIKSFVCRCFVGQCIWCIFTRLQLARASVQHGGPCCRNFQDLVKESSASAGKDMVDRPAMDKHVFCRVLEDCGHVELDDEGCALLWIPNSTLQLGMHQLSQVSLCEPRFV